MRVEIRILEKNMADIISKEISEITSISEKKNAPEVLVELSAIKTEYVSKKVIQDQEKELKGKYKQILKKIDKNNVEYSVTEYVHPDGATSFDIFFYKKIGDDDYHKVISFGAEAELRAKDWTKNLK